MMGEAAFYDRAFAPRQDFSCDLEEYSVYEKLCEVMSGRVLGKKDFRIVYRDTGFIDRRNNKVEVLDPEDFERVYMHDGGSIFEEILENGIKEIGEFDGWLFDRISTPFEDENEEAAESFIKTHSPFEIVSSYMGVPDAILEVLPNFVSDMAGFLSNDPLLYDGGDIYISYFRSALLGRFVSTTKIPESMKRKGLNLLELVADPFDWGYYHTAVKNGEFISLFIAGNVDWNTTVSPMHLNCRWLSAVVLLKEEILRLDKAYHFLERS